jgi:hypothetical protein
MTSVTLSDVRGQLELELTWRVDELRLLQNQLGLIDAEADRDRYRKMLVVMLYSHFEGFCKSAWLLYVDTINKLQIHRLQASDAIAAASLTELFRALEDPQRKCNDFRRDLPDDSKLHRFFRQAEFVTELRNIWRRFVVLPEEQVVDTESNLSVVQLRKALFRLGLPSDAFEAHEGSIHRLVNLRHAVAHGSYKLGVPAADYDKFRDTILDVMNGMLKLVWQALVEKKYLKRAA